MPSGSTPTATPNNPTDVTFVGIDGCESAWIAIALTPDAEVIAIDIPIGLPVAGRREADLAAESFLGSQRNTPAATPTDPAIWA
jgi:predicted RNase H-like nuclease